MGVDTKAILRKDVSIEDLVKHIDKRFNGAKIISTSMNYMFMITFNDGVDNRCMYCHFADYIESDYGINGVLVSLGYWNNSVEIMKYLLDEFGGYLMEKDSDDDFEPYNIESFEDSKEVTELDIFRNKVISVLGFDNLNKVIDLCKEYKEIK